MKTVLLFYTFKSVLPYGPRNRKKVDMGVQLCSELYTMFTKDSSLPDVGNLVLANTVIFSFLKLDREKK